MQFLPLLAVESIAWRLPVSDRSAIILARAMLDGDGPAVVAALADTLSSDPPLTLWSLCRAAQSGIAPRAAKNLAEWLAARVVELLASRNLSTDAAPADGSLVDRYASLVEQAVLRADWAVALASDDPSVPAEEIHLAALVHGPWAWHEAAVGDSSAGGSLPPTNLLPEIPPPIAQRLAESLARLQTAQSTGSEDERLTRCRARAAAVAAQWAVSETASIPLVELAARLARLRALETQFHQTLEAEKLAAMAEFAAGAGHEINNPLAVIAGRAQLLLQEETDPERRRALALMNAQAKRVYEMIADMMLFARPPAPAPQRVELVALVDRILDDLRPRMTEAGVTLRRLGHAGPITIDADPVQLNVALRALCQNALEAIGHDGWIEIALDETPDAAVIRVADNGPGLSDESRRHLFDPYYSERQAGRGLGLGLSKSWRILVTNHHGRIDVQTRPGQETVFTVTLPK